MSYLIDMHDKCFCVFRHDSVRELTLDDLHALQVRSELCHVDPDDCMSSCAPFREEDHVRRPVLGREVIFHICNNIALGEYHYSHYLMTVIECRST